jgi:hypothetical protein
VSLHPLRIKSDITESSRAFLSIENLLIDKIWEIISKEF